MTAHEGCDPPPLYALREDHKNSTNQECPPTRPVCGATTAYHRKVSHLISMVLKEVTKEGNNACESTEDLLDAIEETNKCTQEKTINIRVTLVLKHCTQVWTFLSQQR